MPQDQYALAVKDIQKIVSGHFSCQKFDKTYILDLAISGSAGDFDTVDVAPLRTAFPVTAVVRPAEGLFQHIPAWARPFGTPTQRSRSPATTI